MKRIAVPASYWNDDKIKASRSMFDPSKADLTATTSDIEKPIPLLVWQVCWDEALKESVERRCIAHSSGNVTPNRSLPITPEAHSKTSQQQHSPRTYDFGPFLFPYMDTANNQLSSNNSKSPYANVVTNIIANTGCLLASFPQNKEGEMKSTLVVPPLSSTFKAKSTVGMVSPDVDTSIDSVGWSTAEHFDMSTDMKIVQKGSQNSDHDEKSVRLVTAVDCCESVSFDDIYRDASNNITDLLARIRGPSQSAVDTTTLSPCFLTGADFQEISTRSKLKRTHGKDLCLGDIEKRHCSR